MELALTPTTADVMNARELAMRRLDNGTALDTQQLHADLCEQAGVERQTPRHEELDVVGRGEEATVDLTAATFVRQRLSLAVAEAVGELEAQGLITPVVGADGPDLTVTLRDHGYGYGARFQILRPACRAGTVVAHELWPTHASPARSAPVRRSA